MTFYVGCGAPTLHFPARPGSTSCDRPTRMHFGDPIALAPTAPPDETAPIMAGPPAPQHAATDHPANGDDTLASTTGESRPIPPRFWWLKRLTLAGIAFVIAMLAIRLWWGHYAESRLQAKLAEYRAAGQPVTIEDFQTDPILDEDNAAYYLKQAAAKLVEPENLTIGLRDLSGDAQVHASRLEELTQLLTANQEALRLVRQARSKPQSDWGVQLSSPILHIKWAPNVNRRALYCLPVVAALHAHTTGNDSAAIEYILDALDVARRADENTPNLTRFLARLPGEFVVVRATERIAHDLQVSAVAAPARRNDRGDRRQIDELIMLLLDDEELRHRWRAAMFAERMSIVDARNYATSNSLVRALLGPAWKLGTVRAMTHVTAYAKAGTASNWPAAKSNLPLQLEPWGNTADKAARWFEYIMTPALSSTTTDMFRLRTHCRFAATALAIRLFELDNGRRPARLSELVPDYLPSVPRDPFSDSDSQIGYAPDAPRPVLYSVHIDRIDQGGLYNSGRRSADRDSPDLVFFLNGDRPRPKPPEENETKGTRE